MHRVGRRVVSEWIKHPAPGANIRYQVEQEKATRNCEQTTKDKRTKHIMHTGLVCLGGDVIDETACTQTDVGEGVPTVELDDRASMVTGGGKIQTSRRRKRRRRRRIRLTTGTWGSEHTRCSVRNDAGGDLKVAIHSRDFGWQYKIIHAHFTPRLRYLHRISKMPPTSTYANPICHYTTLSVYCRFNLSLGLSSLISPFKHLYSSFGSKATWNLLDTKTDVQGSKDS